MNYVKTAYDKVCNLEKYTASKVKEYQSRCSRLVRGTALGDTSCTVVVPFETAKDGKVVIDVSVNTTQGTDSKSFSASCGSASDSTASTLGCARMMLNVDLTAGEHEVEIVVASRVECTVYYAVRFDGYVI